MTGGHRIDGRGATLMPGLVDAHLHLSWNHAPGIAPIQLMPVAAHMISTIEMAKVVLDAGFTAGRGDAAARPRLAAGVQTGTAEWRERAWKEAEIAGGTVP